MLFCVKQRGENLVCMPLPGGSLQGFDHAYMHVCILEKWLWEAVCLACMAKSFCRHGGKSTICLYRAQRWSTWWRSDSTSNLSSVPDTCSSSHLITSSLPLLSSITISHVLLCFSLFSLFCWQRLNVTPSAVACWHVGECFISAALCVAWLGCTGPSADTHTHTHIDTLYLCSADTGGIF